MPRVSRRRFLAAALAAPALARPALSQPMPVPAPPADGSAGFACDLYAKLRAGPGNVFASPFSIRVALAMTAAGAGGETLADMRKVLRLDADPAKADAAMKALLSAVNGAGVPAEKRGYELATANALWAQKGYPFRAEFRTRAEAVYGAGVRETDFAADPEAGRLAINAWALKETRDKIRDLLAPGVLTRDTRLVLTNAIYFKGTWAEPFNKALTKDAPFATADGSKVPVPLMKLGAALTAVDRPADPYQAVELPYHGQQVAMLLVVPRKPDGLPAVEAKLTAAWLAELTRSLESRPGSTLFLPRFKVETKYELKEPLTAMGLGRAFGDRADFTGMATAEQLMIDKVIHKALVEVNEEGTVAAAATAVTMRPTSAVQPRPPVVVRADRPFLFLLRHRPTGEVLFVGRYTGG